MPPASILPAHGAKGFGLPGLSTTAPRPPAMQDRAPALQATPMGKQQLRGAASAEATPVSKPAAPVKKWGAKPAGATSSPLSGASAASSAVSRSLRTSGASSAASSSMLGSTTTRRGAASASSSGTSAASISLRGAGRAVGARRVAGSLSPAPASAAPPPPATPAEVGAEGSPSSGTRHADSPVGGGEAASGSPPVKRALTFEPETPVEGGKGDAAAAPAAAEAAAGPGASSQGIQSPNDSSGSMVAPAAAAGAARPSGAPHGGVEGLMAELLPLACGVLGKVCWRQAACRCSPHAAAHAGPCVHPMQAHGRMRALCMPARQHAACMQRMQLQQAACAVRHTCMR